jgi:hypothetical protein
MDQPADATSGETDGARRNRGNAASGKLLANGTGRQNAGDKPDDWQNSNDAAPAKPKWKLTIYEGKTPRIEEIELPDADDRGGRSSNDGRPARKAVKGA